MPSLVIDNFQGGLTRYNDGNINSGRSKYTKTFGNDPFTSPGNLTWFEAPTRIDAAASVITDLIMTSRTRLESGITYVYAIGHTGRLYKIQVNDPTTYNPDYDNPVLLATLTAQTPTFKFGASLQFFGATERIYIGHDKGVTRIDFNGTNETFVGALGSYTANVPRPSVNFVGKLYFGNGTNILEIDSTATVTTYTKLDPAFPVGTQVRDIDVSPDGNYTQIVVSRVAQSDLTTTTQDTSSLSSADSYFILWNGEDVGYTAYTPYNSYSLNANEAFGPFSYTTGYDLGGAAVYSNGQKILSLPNSQVPNFNATFSTGNLFGFAAPEQDASVQKGTMMSYGAYDSELPAAFHRWFRLAATTQTDIVQIPDTTIVSNLFFGSSPSGYTDNKVGSAKLYFSTLETDDTPTTTFKLYKFTTVPTGAGDAIGGVYETQSQLFSKKIRINEIRLYTEPLVANNSFKIDLIGSSGDVMTNGSKTFTVGTAPVVAGDDFLWWNPQVAPTYAIGIRITNLGTKNWVGTKLELDYSEGGK
jgi:hypothetical protein